MTLRRLLVRLSNNNQVLDEILTTAVAAGFALGLFLVIASVADMADLSSGLIELAALISIPLVFMLIWRWAKVAAKAKLNADLDRELLLTKDIMVAP
jgi:hypothetical protein